MKRHKSFVNDPNYDLSLPGRRVDLGSFAKLGPGLKLNNQDIL